MPFGVSDLKCQIRKELEGEGNPLSFVVLISSTKIKSDCIEVAAFKVESHR